MTSCLFSRWRISVKPSSIDFDLLFDLLSWRRGWANRHAASPGSSIQNNVESSLLLDECRCHVVCSRPSPCQFHLFLGLPCLLSHAHIRAFRGVPVSDIWYDPFFAHDQKTAFTVAVRDLLRPGVDYNPIKHLFIHTIDIEFM